MHVNEGGGHSWPPGVLSLPPIPAPNTVIWRYVSFAKLVSLLHSRALYFSRIDRFADQHEAVFSRKTIETWLNFAAQVGLYSPEGNGFEAESGFQQVSSAVFALFTQQIRKGVFANCWHRSEYESGAMWDLYASQGIAIQSTVHRLASSTRSFDPPVQIREVLYVDHDSDEINEGFLFLYKKHFYRHEQEIRAFITNVPSDTAGQDDASLRLGIAVPCDLEQLIAEIRLPPGSPHWLIEAVTSVLERYELANVPVSQSEADAIPDYLKEAGSGMDHHTIIGSAKKLFGMIPNR